MIKKFLVTIALLFFSQCALAIDKESLNPAFLKDSMMIIWFLIYTRLWKTITISKKQGML